MNLLQGSSADGAIIPLNENYLEGFTSGDAAGYLMTFGGDASKFALNSMSLKRMASL